MEENNEIAGPDLSRLERFGWRGSDHAGVARIVSAHGDYYHIVCDDADGELLARKKKSAFMAEDALKPITGDFVAFRHNPHGESLLTAVIPRRSWFLRRDPTARRKAQTLAVNFDTLFIMMSMTENFSLPRLKRYLNLAEDMGEARAVLVLTKADLATDDARAKALQELAQSGIALPHVLAVSARTGEGLDAVRAFAKPRQTLAFIGSSGVGKSTLLNALAGEDWMATQEVQAWSGKGRHTTTSRELVMLPCGAMVIDTPGIREIGRLGETDLSLVKGEASHRYRKRLESEDPD